MVHKLIGDILFNGAVDEVNRFRVLIIRRSRSNHVNCCTSIKEKRHLREIFFTSIRLGPKTNSLNYRSTS